MDEAPQPPPPAKRNPLGLLLLVVAVGGSAVGVSVYQYFQSQKKSGVDTTGFDVAQTTDNGTTVARTATTQAQSGLGMIQTGGDKMQFGTRMTSTPNANPANPNQPAAGPGNDSYEKVATAFSVLCVQNEGKVRGYAQQMTRQYPILQQYGKDWMSYPDLKKLNDDYMRLHDPVAFLRGLAKSDSFPALLKKYAGDPTIQKVATQSLQKIPTDLMMAGTDYVAKDNVVKDLVDKVASSLGLPPGMFGGTAASIDKTQVINSVVGGNPTLQKAMDDHPELQQQIQNASGKRQ